MRLKVNSVPVRGGLGEVDSIGGLIDSLRENAEIAPNEVVVSIDLDSQTWEGADLRDLQDMPVEHIDDVDINTDNQENYLRNVLTDISKGLDVMLEASSALAEEFRREPEEETNMQFFNLLDSLQQILMCTYQLKDAAGEEIEIDMSSSLENISGVLDILGECQKSQDWTKMADTLDTRLSEALKEFKKTIDKQIILFKDGA